MAAPAEKTLKNLTGKWTMNKSISGSADPVLALQGVGYLTRKAIGLASVAIDVNQYEAPPNPPNTSTDVITHIDIEQTAAGLSSTQENRCLDDTFREHADWLFGKVKGKSRWIKLAEVTDDFLKTGWEDPEGDFFQSYVESLDNEWIATQIWGFQQIDGVRRYCRNVMVTKKDEKVTVRLVYDWQG